MQTRFIGGPYDGRTFDRETISRWAMLHPYQSRLFVLMPPVESFGRAQGIHPYERIVQYDTVEFHWVQEEYDVLFEPQMSA